MRWRFRDYCGKRGVRGKMRRIRWIVRGRWCIDGRLYDPLFAEAKSFSKNYDADYTDYRIHPAYTKKL